LCIIIIPKHRLFQILHSKNTYTHDDNRFSIEYPDNWVLGEGHADALAAFDDEYDWRTEVQVFWNDDDTLDNRSDTKVLRGIETVNYELCRDVTFAADDRECSDFKVGDSYIMYTNDNRKVYFVESTYTLVWQNISGSFIINGKEYDLVRTSSYIFDKNGSMEIVTESIGTYQKHSDEIMHMIKSFSLNPTQTSTSTPTPTPTLTVKEVTVFNTVGSSSPGCEINNSCFTPYQVSININDKVTWKNNDNSVHTVTSGTLSNGPDGAFDSEIIYSGNSFTVEFLYDGTYPYFCRVHPWMEGSVVVSSVSAVTIEELPQQQTQQPEQQTDAEQKIAELEAQQKAAEERIAELEKESGGGCLIATAAFGSELAPQVQFLREIRDNTVLQTEAGTSFMTGFNQFYYSFSPAIADYERENPVFKEVVKLALTPLLTSLTLLQYADIDSESEMLGYGIGIILLNIGMYFVAPAVLIMKIRKRI